MSEYQSYTAYASLWNKSFPSHWSILPMYALAKEKSICGCVDLPLLSVYLDVGVIPFSAKTEKRTNVTSKDLSKYQRVDCGDFVLNNQQAWRGSVGISFDTGIVSPAYIVLSMNDILNSRYANYLLRSQIMVDQYLINSKSVGSIQRNIYWPALKRASVPVPARDEQDQIVRFLDWKVSGINKLINIRHKEISELNESLNTKLRDVLLSVPNVKEVPLKRICSVPMTDGPHETTTFVYSGIPFVSAEASHDGRIHLDECRGFITREQHEVYCQKVRPHKNDIFIVKSGSTTGKTVMVDFDDEFSIWSPLALVRCNNLAMPRYVFFYCTSVMFQKQVRDNWSFGTQPNIGMGVLENLRLPLPEIEEQRAIVDTLDAYWSKVLQVKCNLKKQIEELQSLKTRIIADAVTGKIDVRGIEIPEYEFVDEDNDNVDENLEQGADEPPEEE